MDETTALIPSVEGQSYQSTIASTDSDTLGAGDNRSDEENALLPKPHSEEEFAPLLTSVATVVSVLLLGEFISNADSTLVMAAAGKISSEFRRLQDANWLSTGYSLGVCAAQPMYGKLSDIYGRKPLLLISYFLLGLGCLISGIGPDMSIVIMGRCISGVGGAGIMTMGSIIITDIVPRRDLATWRAYINIAMTLGRSLGGPVGGYLTDAIGWRWAFTLQAPLLALAALLVIVKLKINHRHDSKPPAIGRVDFLGSLLLSSSIVLGIILLDRVGHVFPWLSWQASLLAGSSSVLFTLFLYVEKYVAAEPIFDLNILRYNVVISYLIGALQITAQLGMMFSVPLYFQVTQRASATVAGGHMVPAVIGNTVGGLLAGKVIKATGRYKPLLVVAGLVAATSYVLLFTRWNGKPGFPFWESLDIFPGGMGTGISSAAAFVSMTSPLEPHEIGMATSGYMLLISFAMSSGVTLTNTVLGLGFRKQLQRNLHGPGADTIIRRAMSDTSYINQLEGKVREIVINCYVSGLKNTYVISMAASILGSLLGWAVQQHQL